MKNTIKIALQLAIVALLVISCQKDYYLEELNDTKDNLDAALLSTYNQVQVNNELTMDLATQIEVNSDQADQLVGLESDILDLNDTLMEANLLSDTQQAEALVLIDEIANMNLEITALQDLLVEALVSDSLNLEVIESLTMQIAVLEAREPLVVIEYVEVISEVISTNVVENGITIDALQAEISDLTQQANHDTPDAVIAIGVALTDVASATTESGFVDAMATPSGRAGRWFTSPNYPGFAIQAYYTNGDARFAAFAINDGNVDFLLHSGRTFQHALDAIVTAKIENVVDTVTSFTHGDLAVIQTRDAWNNIEYFTAPNGVEGVPNKTANISFGTDGEIEEYQVSANGGQGTFVVVVDFADTAAALLDIEFYFNN